MLTTTYARLFTPVMETKSVEQSVSTPNALMVVTIPRERALLQFEAKDIGEQHAN